MQGLVDVGRMGCSSLAAQPIQPISTNQKTLYAPVNFSLMHFIKYIKV
jgi:hypothetical protein